MRMEGASPCVQVIEGGQYAGGLTFRLLGCKQENISSISVEKCGFKASVCMRVRTCEGQYAGRSRWLLGWQQR